MANSNDNGVNSQQPDNALAFRASMSNIFKNIAESVSEEEFAECLTFLKSKPAVIRKLHRAMANNLYESLNTELEGILSESNLSEGLGKLKELRMEATHDPNHIAWRPPGNVQQHLRSHDAEKILQEQERLQALVDELEAENNVLREEIAEKRTAVRNIDERVNRASKTGFSTLPHMEKTSDCMQKYIEDLYE